MFPPGLKRRGGGGLSTLKLLPEHIHYYPVVREHVKKGVAAPPSPLWGETLVLMNQARNCIEDRERGRDDSVLATLKVHTHRNVTLLNYRRGQVTSIYLQGHSRLIFINKCV